MKKKHFLHYLWEICYERKTGLDPEREMESRQVGPVCLLASQLSMKIKMSLSMPIEKSQAEQK